MPILTGSFPSALSKREGARAFVGEGGGIGSDVHPEKGANDPADEKAQGRHTGAQTSHLQETG
jgi:hypothetical protein